MDWKDIRNTIASFAPALGTALVGPAGAAVGAMVASALGVEDDPVAVEQALKHDPDASFELIKLERQLGFQILKEELKDKQDARKHHKNHWMPSVLTILLALMVSLMFTGLLLYAVPQSIADILYLITGQILTAFLTTVAFWMGTSRSSQEKNGWLK